VQIDGLSFRYSRRGPWVLQDVNLRIDAGEIVIVLGPNGVGKSTLLQLLAGVLRPSRGVVRDRPPVVGWVPERFPADQPFTARGYLGAMAAVRGVGGTASIEAWADRLHCRDYLDVKLSDLSKGTAQKVGLIQALLTPPGLLVLDEPWEGLDAETRQEVPLIVAEVVGRGGAVLISDHRGETARLPDARVWRVGDATVVPEEETRAVPKDDERCVIEVSVPAARASATVAELRAAGHDVLRVRGF
jgi:ABC-type multidrug transport system ATPase subunit